MKRALASALCSVLASCASTSTSPATTATVSPPDVSTMSCRQLAQLSAAQKRAIIDDQRGLFDWRRARCAVDAGDVEEAREVSRRFVGEQGAAMRDLLEVLIALRAGAAGDDVKELVSVWVSTGQADARAFVRERAFRAVAQEGWYVDMALSAWDADRKAGRAAPLASYVKDLAAFTGRPFVDGAATTVPGALTIAQGQLMETRVDGEQARVRVASLHAQWAVVDQRSWGDGTRTEYKLGWRITGADQIVTRTESVETFSLSGHTFFAEIPTYAAQWQRIVLVGVIVDGAREGEPPLVRSLLVLPREVRMDTERRYAPNEFPSPPAF